MPNLTKPACLSGREVEPGSPYRVVRDHRHLSNGQLAVPPRVAARSSSTSTATTAWKHAARHVGLLHLRGDRLPAGRGGGDERW